jgi:hypothetical protein
MCSGDFQIPIPPPRSKRYKVNRLQLDKLDVFLRVEAYRGDTPGAGAPVWAGWITDLDKRSSDYTIHGKMDPWMLSRQVTFPNDITYRAQSDTMLKAYLSTHEDAFFDDFNPYTPANWTGTFQAGGFAPTVTGVSDAGIPAVSFTTGAKSCLLSNTAGNNDTDADKAMLAEVTGRCVVPSVDVTNSGEFGVVICQSITTGMAVKARFKYVTASSDYAIDIIVTDLAGVNPDQVVSNVMTGITNAGDFDFQLQVALNGQPITLRAIVTLNGQKVSGPNADGSFNAYNAPLATNKLGLWYERGPGTAIQVWYWSVINQARRGNGSGVTDPIITNTIPAFSASSPNGSAVAPNHLDQVAVALELEAWQARFTPLAMAAGKRTISNLTAATQIGTDLSKVIEFSRAKGNLIDAAQGLAFADVATDVTLSAPPGGSANGGTVVVRNRGAVSRYGYVSSAQLTMTARNYRALLKRARRMNGTQTTLFAAKQITVLRDIETADQYREGDIVMVDSPEDGINRTAYQIVSMSGDQRSVAHVLQLANYSFLQVGIGADVRSIQQIGALFKTR